METLNPKALKPKPETLNPKPQSPKALNPKPFFSTFMDFMEVGSLVRGGSATRVYVFFGVWRFFVP